MTCGIIHASPISRTTAITSSSPRYEEVRSEREVATELVRETLDWLDEYLGPVKPLARARDLSALSVPCWAMPGTRA